VSARLSAGLLICAKERSRPLAATAGETFCPGKPSKMDSECQGFPDDMGMIVANSPAHLAALLDRVRAGDEPALTELIQHYEPRLRTAAHVLLGPLLRPSMDSVDLVQSVHRVLLPGLREGKFDLSSPEQVLALALTIIRRKVA